MNIVMRVHRGQLQDEFRYLPLEEIEERHLKDVFARQLKERNCTVIFIDNDKKKTQRTIRERIL